MSPHNCKAFSAAFSAAFLMGVLGYFVRESGCSAAICTFARYFLGLLLLGILYFRSLFLRGEARFSLSSALAGVGISLCIFFYCLAIQRCSLGIAALLVYTGPVYAAVGEAILRRRLPRTRDIALIFLSALGIFIVSFFAEEGLSGGNLQGVVFGLLSGLCYASYILLNRQIPEEVSLERRAFWQSLAGSLVLIFPLLAEDADVALYGLAEGWPYLLSIGALQGFAVLMLVAYAVKYLSAIQYGSIAYLEPIVAVGLGWLVYQDPINALQWGGIALVLSASLLQALSAAHADKEEEEAAEIAFDGHSQHS